jgi:2-succinyl-6-hydroxy-2,4-cyclohexadiene-1-carboxylate synthase
VSAREPEMALLDLRANGLRYRLRLAGEGEPLLLLHGFTGSGATWEPHIPRLGRGQCLIAVDLPGHGGTEAPTPDRCRVEQVVPDLLALLDQLRVERFALLGYSMGGRLALHLALAAPSRVHALLLESASPGLAGEEERAARREADESLAASLEREGLEAFVARWEAQPLFACQARLPAAEREQQRALRLSHDARGLAASLRGMGAGVPPPLHHRLAELTMPVLLLAGEQDEKFRALAVAMRERLPRAHLAVVPQAGHSVHLEQPEAFETAVLRFLAESGTAPHGRAGSATAAASPASYQ